MGGMDALVIVFSLSTHALVTVFSWNTNEILVWTGCSSHRIL